MQRHPKTLLLLLLGGVALTVPRVGRAQDAAKTGDAPTLGLDTGLSLDPTAPQTGALPGGLAPAFGTKSLSEGEWRFDFHGFLTAPLNAGIGSRAMPMPGQSSTTLHTPPVVPDDLETFSHTGVVPTTYGQLNFSEGNSIVTANVSILARQSNASTSFVEPADQLGVTDLFVSILPRIPRVRTEVMVGAFTTRYGSTGEYDEGRYGTPLIARVNGVGERVVLRVPFGRWLLVGEQGLVGNSNKAGATVTPDIWNDFADPNAGSSFVHHGHLGLGYGRWALAGLHYLRAWSQDDRANPSLTPNAAPDGSIDIYAADLRLELGRFGHAYGAASYTKARYAGTVSRVISVLNTQGGQGLIDNYFGPLSVGNGNLTTIGFQYDLSIGKLVSYPIPFSGDGPDLFVSAFGMITHVQSDDTQYDSNGRFYNGVTKRKIGVLASYSVLSWLALTTRYDQVDPDTQDRTFSFAVLSPGVIFRSDWTSTDQIVLQYSHWFDGGHTLVRVGDPPREYIGAVPDGDMISLSASMWW
jgi:hypothetical protein